MIGQIIEKINKLYNNRLDNIVSIENKRYDSYFINPYLVGLSQLTQTEIEVIRAKWGGGVIPFLSRGYDFYRALKVIDEFNPNYLPSSYYFPIIEGALNPKEHKFNLSHKSVCDFLYKGIVKFPTTVLRCYNGVYFDSALQPLSPLEAMKILMADDEVLLFKPAYRTVQGMGIKLLHKKDIENFANQIKSGETVVKCPDFVLQRLVRQHADTKVFNSTSLNCMRITTLNLNGTISVCTRALKAGSANAVVDNIGTGKKGVAVGINEDGTLRDFGYYGNGERTEAHNGVVFKGKSIPLFDKIIETAKELHSVNSVCKIIGWDLALDDNNEVVLIEGNSAHPGISVEQIATGPVFGNRTDEVIDFIRSTI